MFTGEIHDTVTDVMPATVVTAVTGDGTVCELVADGMIDPVGVDFAEVPMRLLAVTVKLLDTPAGTTRLHDRLVVVHCEAMLSTTAKVYVVESARPLRTQLFSVVTHDTVGPPGVMAESVKPMAT